MSAKKDALGQHRRFPMAVPMNGMSLKKRATWSLFTKASTLMVVLPEEIWKLWPLALEKVSDDDHIQSTGGPGACIWVELMLATMAFPLLSLVGGHGIFVDARQFLPHISSRISFLLKPWLLRFTLDSGVQHHGKRYRLCGTQG
jgi:hypothetical protein